MPELFFLAKAGLYALMLVSLLAAVAAVTLPNIFHAALCLVLTLLGIAGLYLGLQAEFIAVVQILIYVGAVMTLVIFSVMLTERMGEKTIPQKNNLSLPAFSGAVIFSVVLVRVLGATPWAQRAAGTWHGVTSAELGKSLMGPYIFPFEVISVILIAALVGAIVIAKKEKD